MQHKFCKSSTTGLLLTWKETGFTSTVLPCQAYTVHFTITVIIRSAVTSHKSVLLLPVLWTANKLVLIVALYVSGST